MKFSNNSSMDSLIGDILKVGKSNNVDNKSRVMDLTYKKYISEYEYVIYELLEQKGVKLLEANAGGGKTYSILNIGKQLLDNDFNRAVVIACPSKVQNLQNMESYGHLGCKSVVGGVTVDENDRMLSCVYDKVLETVETLFKRGKKVTLVIDEAHHLIYSSFRGQALEQFRVIFDNDMVESCLHMTATPFGLDMSKYDIHVKMERENLIPSIDNTYLLNDFGSKTDKIASLINKIHSSNKNTNPLTMVRIESKATAVIISKLLQEKGISSEYINSDNKNDSAVFENIVKKSVIEDGVKVLLSTSVLDCGTNILNDGVDRDINVIYATRDQKDFSFNDIIQYSARFRKEMSVKGFYVLLGNDNSESIIIPSIDDLEKAIFNDYQLYSSDVDFLNQYSEFLLSKDADEKDVKNLVSKTLHSVKFDGSKNHENCIKFNSISKKVEVLINSIREIHYRKYQNLFYNIPLGALEYLNGKLNTKKIQLMTFSDKKIEDAEMTELTKSLKQEDRDNKKRAKEEFKINFAEFVTENPVIAEVLVTGHDTTLVNNIPEETKEEVDSLLNSKAYETYKSTIKGMIKFGASIEEVAQKLQESETDADFKRHYERQSNSFLYNMYKVDKNSLYGGVYLKAGKEYAIVRDVLAKKEKKQGKISKKDLQAIIEQFKANKLSTFNDKVSKGKVVATAEKQLLNKLKTVYNLSKDGRISSIVM